MAPQRWLVLALAAAASCTGTQTRPDTPAAQAAKQLPTPEGDDAAADEARFKRAKAFSDAGMLTEAEAAFTEILEKHPTSRFKQQASVELGLAQARLGKKHDAEQTLKAAQGTMTEPEKRQAEVALQQAEARAGESPEALARAAKDAEASADKLAEFYALLDAAPADAVARLAAGLDHKSAAWPAAALKLSRVQVHLGDRTHSLQMLEEVAAQGGTTPAHQAARALRDELKQSSQVNPKLIGIVLPRTGKFAALSNLILDAISMQIDLQDRGPLRAIVKDSKGEPDAAQQAVEELAREGVIGIIGPIGPAESTAAAVRAQELGIPIVLLSRAEGLTQLGAYVFREMTTSSQQARAVSKYAAEKLGAKTFALLQPDSPSGEELGRLFWDGVDAAGGEMRGFEHYADRSTNFKKTVQRLVGRDNLAERKEFVEEEARIAQEITDPYRKRKALAQLRSAAAPIIDFDVLFLADFADEVRLLAPALAAEDIISNGCDVKELEVAKKTTKKEDLRTVQLLGWMGWDSPQLVDPQMGAARYVQCSIFVDAFYNRSQRPATQKFVESYEQSYKRLPLLLEAHAHDAAGIVKSVIESRRPQTRDDLREALARMPKAFEGAAGDTTFDHDREAQKPLFWLWISKGDIHEFDPTGQPPVPLVPSAQAARDAAQKPQ